MNTARKLIRFNRGFDTWKYDSIEDLDTQIQDLDYEIDQLLKRSEELSNYRDDLITEKVKLVDLTEEGHRRDCYGYWE